jgi:hypothetical protein
VKFVDRCVEQDSVAELAGVPQAAVGQAQGARAHSQGDRKHRVVDLTSILRVIGTVIATLCLDELKGT